MGVPKESRGSGRRDWKGTCSRVLGGVSYVLMMRISMIAKIPEGREGSRGTSKKREENAKKAGQEMKKPINLQAMGEGEAT